MPENEIRKELNTFKVEVLERLARIEAKLESNSDKFTQQVKSSEGMYGAEIRHLKEEVEEIKEEKTWLWRCIVGTAIVVAFQMVAQIAGR